MTRNRHQEKKGKKTPLPLFIMISGLALVGVVALVLFGSKGSSNPILERGTPVLKVDKELVDFGDVPLGQFVTASFTLTNAGDGTLRFSEAPYVELKAGC